MIQKLLKDVSLYSVGIIIRHIGELILLPVYARLLTVSEFGMLSIFLVSAALINALISTPVNSGLYRFYHNPKYKKPRELVFQSAFLVFFISIIISLFITMISEEIAKIMDIPQIAVFCFCFIILVQPLSVVFYSIIRLEQKAKRHLFASTTGTIFLIVITVFLVIVLNMGLCGILIGLASKYFFEIIIISPKVIRRMRASLDRKVLKEPLGYGLPLIFSGFSIFIINWSDRYIIDQLESHSETGIYSMGYDISKVLRIILITPVNYAVVPLFLKMERDIKTLKQIVRKGSEYYFLIAIFLAFCLSVFSEELIMLISGKEAYLKASVIIPIISYSLVLHGWGYFVGFSLLIKKKTLLISKLVIYAALVNVALNFILIPFIGILGAAFATLISYILWSCLRVHYSHKIWHINFNIPRVVKVTLIYIVLILAMMTVPLSGYAPVLLIKALSIVILALILFFFIMEDSERKESIKTIKDLYRGARIFTK